ncbi:MAG: hypothetical protein M1827_007371 [Pycnora praestabilis]|nr:MAG: hypothetical protein M1827_007371 [Pycnora praestabilis]
MGPFVRLLLVYTFGGLTFIPLVIAVILIHGYLTFPIHTIISSTKGDLLEWPGDDKKVLGLGASGLAEKFQSRSHEPDVAAGYFAVCREYVPGGVNGKPPERTTPAGAVVAAESPSVYQSMYRSIFDRNKASNIEGSKLVKKARNVFFVVLRHGHLMLYDDSEQLEVRHVISLEHHDVRIDAGGEKIPEGELWIKRNAICLSRKRVTTDDTSISKPFYLFSENCSEKEDFYFALLQNQERKPNASVSPPTPQQFDVKHIISLVQRLHSSEEHLQSRWINGLVGRLFLALYQSPEVEQYIRTKITKKIARVKKPAFLSDIVLQKIDMGEGAPYITNPRLKDLTVDGDCCAEADVTYSGNFRLEIAATARIELGSRFKAREVDLVLAAVLKKLEGHVLIRIKPPPSNRIWMTFETMPKIDMAISPIVSSRQITYNIILRAIESRIREVIAETVVLPHWDDSPFTDTIKQEFRGGVWARQRSTNTPASQEKEPEEQPKEDELEKEVDSDNGEVSLAASFKSKEKTMSMPILSSIPPSSLRSRQATLPLQSAAELKESGASSGNDALPRSSEKPKVIRSHSFASAATPSVSMDTTTVDAIKDQSKREHRDATSAMIAISQRSQPTSPTETPVGSPRGLQTCLASVGSSSPTSSVEEDVPEEALPPSSIATPSQSPLSSTPSNISGQANRITQGFGSDSRQPEASILSVQSSQHPEKRQSIGSIGSATAAAKKWGWGVLSRNNENKPGETGLNSQASEIPNHPIGRGRPLPPPGTPLPRPERNTSSISIPISAPKRKPLPPPTLPERRQEVTTRHVPKPPLPARRVNEKAVTDDQSEDGLLVVAAPPESEPASPLDDSRSGYVQPLDVEVADDGDAATSSEKETIHGLSSRLSDSIEDEDGLPSWVAAQEEEARAKSLWMDADHDKT